MSNKRNLRNNSSGQEEHNMTVDEKLNLLLDEIRQVKLGNSECLNEITKIKDDIKCFKEDISKTLDLCFEKIKDCDENVRKNSNSITTCESIVDSLKSENGMLKRSVNELKKKVSAGEQYSRSNCLEINGVPEAKNENVVAVVKRVANVLNFNLEDTMIDAVHRLARNPNKPESPRGIILKFCRRLDMEEMRRRARVKRSVTAQELGYQSERRVFIDLSLGRETRHLWAELRKFKMQNNYKYAWITSAGKMFLRKKEGDAAILISEAMDLERLK